LAADQGEPQGDGFRGRAVELAGFPELQAPALVAAGRTMFVMPREILMRILALAILTMATVLTATPTLAQTYDPKYPVCLQIYQGMTDFYFECAYTSLAQCNMSASGRAAQCVINPYFAGAKTSPGRRDRQRRHVHH
jgi:hypothetical protein